LEIEVSTTKENLKYATKIELAEIDRQYPRYLKRIKPEGHEEALEYLTYAWEAEQQHRDLIKDIRSGTGIFYSMLLKYFSSNPSRFYVNQNCGTTLTELPEGGCPICHQPLETFVEIPKPQEN
ncbi:ferritin family protein, partial [Pseudomonadota bacterium]